MCFAAFMIGVVVGGFVWHRYGEAIIEMYDAWRNG